MAWWHGGMVAWWHGGMVAWWGQWHGGNGTVVVAWGGMGRSAAWEGFRTPLGGLMRSGAHPFGMEPARMVVCDDSDYC